MDRKFRKYARIGVWYYIIFDPQQLIQKKDPLQVYQLSIGRYVPKDDYCLEQIGLEVTLWDGAFEGFSKQWLRWCDADGKLILTGEEGSIQEHQRAEQEYQRAEQAEARAERLAALLRESGVEYE